MKKARRVLIAGLGTLTVATALIGAAHTKPARPLMAMLGKSLGMKSKGGCPLGYDKKASPEERTAAFHQFGETHRGDAAAPVRPALGFDLDQATVARVQDWARAHGVTCDEKNRSGHDLECKNVRTADVGADGEVALSTVWLDFDGAGHLESVMTLRRDASPAAIGATYASIRTDLDHNAGAPALVREDGSPEKLASGALYQASTEYRFTNYYAMVRATNVGGGNYLLTEEYRSLND